MEEIIQSDYKLWFAEIKDKVRSAQVKAAVAVNSALIKFYWELGNMIVEKQKTTQWGDKLIPKLSADLKSEFKELKGLSTTNLKYCKQFVLFYQEGPGQQPVDQLMSPFGQQPVDQIPWGHNILIFTKCASIQEARFYISQTLNDNWSRNTLALQLKSDLYSRQGKAVTNFRRTLPLPQSELAEQTIKDPYVFDFLTLTEPYKEKDIEMKLVENVKRFLLELGKGFAFVGQQHNLQVAGNDYYLDLLFYHIVLKCYVVIELKNSHFIPEYAGKMNFYLSALDSCLKNEDDKPTIGILLCRDKNNIEVEFALRDLNKPMGVSEFQFTEILPEDLKSSMPTVEEIEKELSEKTKKKR